VESETEIQNAVVDVKFRNYIFQYKYNKLRDSTLNICECIYDSNDNDDDDDDDDNVCVPLNNLE